MTRADERGRAGRRGFCFTTLLRFAISSPAPRGAPGVQHDGPLPGKWLPSRERPVYGCPWLPGGAYTDGVEYKGARAPVREDLREAHRFILDHVRSPGTWWTGAERAA